MTGCDVTDWKQGAILVFWMLIEAWLGKTEKTRYSSTLEFAVMGTVNLLKSFFKKGVQNERDKGTT